MNARHVMAAVALIVLAGASALQAQTPAPTPAQTFTTTCAACHGPAGTPNPGMVRAMGAMPDFATLRAPADSVWVRSITSGKGKMPAYGSRLNPAQVRAMVAYLKTLKK
jgi:mono/diheme cytochrome c family protein